MAAVSPFATAFRKFSAHPPHQTQGTRREFYVSTRARKSAGQREADYAVYCRLQGWKKEPDVPPDETHMSLWDHLEELRAAIMKSVMVLAACTGVGFLAADRIFTLLLLPVSRLGSQVEMIYNAPTDAFMIQFKMAMIAGCALASPFILHIFAQFIAPALHARERRTARIIILAGAACFVLGLALGYGLLFLVFPMLLSFGHEGVRQLWPLTTYISFCTRTLLACGLILELPVIMAGLARIGVLHAEWLTRMRPYAYIAIFVLVIIVSPSPDVPSQLLMTLPVWGLFEIGIILVRIQQKRRARHQQAETSEN